MEVINQIVEVLDKEIFLRQKELKDYIDMRDRNIRGNIYDWEKGWVEGDLVGFKVKHKCQWAKAFTNKKWVDWAAKYGLKQSSNKRFETLKRKLAKRLIGKPSDELLSIFLVRAYKEGFGKIGDIMGYKEGCIMQYLDPVIKYASLKDKMFMIDRVQSMISRCIEKFDIFPVDDRVGGTSKVLKE